MIGEFSASTSKEHFTLMRRILQLSVLVLAAGAVNACSPDEIITTTAIPTSGVRFINAVPDTGGMDFRFVDIPENNVQWQISFRNSPVLAPTGVNGVPGASTVLYKPARAGQRQFRIFMDGTTAAVASTVVKDTTVTLEAGKNYTALLWGYANPTGPNRPAGALAMRLMFFEETVVDPGALVAIRVINAHNAAVDVRYYPSTGAAPGTTLALGVAPLTMSTHVTTAASAATAAILYNVQPAGGGAVLFADRRALTGDTAKTVAPGPLDAIPGTRVAGSAVTGIVFPPSVLCTAPACVGGAPQGAGSATIPSWTAPAIVYIWDRRPRRPAGI